MLLRNVHAGMQQLQGSQAGMTMASQSGGMQRPQMGGGPGGAMQMAGRMPGMNVSRPPNPMAPQQQMPPSSGMYHWQS